MKNILILLFSFVLIFSLIDEIEGKKVKKHKSRGKKDHPQRRKKWLNLCSFVNAHAQITSKFRQFVGFRTPCHLLDVEFEEDQKANLGNILTITLNDNTPAPMVKYSEAKDDKNYELVMLDYDRLRKKDEGWVVWHVESVTGTQLKTGFDGSSTEIQVKSGEVKKYQRLILLLYEKSGDNSVVNEDNFRLGCCPKAGNFFRILNPIDARVTGATQKIQTFLDENPDLPATETLQAVKDVLEDIELPNPNGAARRETGCSKLLEIKTKLGEATTLLDSIDTSSNNALDELVKSLKEVLSNIEKEIQQQIEDEGCSTPTTQSPTSTVEVTGTTTTKSSTTTTTTTTSGNVTSNPITTSQPVIFYQLVDYWTKRLKLTIRDDELVCRSVDENADEDWWQFIRIGGIGKRRKEQTKFFPIKINYYVQNKNGQRLSRNSSNTGVILSDGTRGSQKHFYFSNTFGENQLKTRGRFSELTLTFNYDENSCTFGKSSNFSRLIRIRDPNAPTTTTTLNPVTSEISPPITSSPGTTSASALPNLQARFNELIKNIDSFVDDNLDSPASENLKLVKDYFRDIVRYLNPFTPASRRETPNTIECSNLVLIGNKLDQAKFSLSRINTNGNVVLQELVETLKEAVSNMENETNKQYDKEGCDTCKPNSDSIERGVFFKIVGNNTNGLKLTVRDGKVVCKRDDVDDEDDWWQFNRTVIIGGFGQRDVYHYIQNKNGQRLKMNQDWTLTLTSDIPPERPTRVNDQLFYVHRFIFCYHTIRHLTFTSAKTLFFRGDECVWQKLNQSILVEKERLILLKRDPNAPTTTTKATTAGITSSTALTTSSTIVSSDFQDRVNELIQRIDDFIDDNPGSFALDNLRGAKEDLGKIIKYLNPTTASRRELQNKTPECRSLQDIDRLLVSAKLYLDRIDIIGNFGELRRFVESLKEAVSNMMNEIQRRYVKEGCTKCKPLSDSIEYGGVFFKIVGNNTGSKLTIRDGKVVCKSDDVDGEDDWWKFNLTVIYGRYSARTEYHNIINKNGQRLMMNRNGTVSLTTYIPPYDRKRPNNQLFLLRRGLTCYHTILSWYYSPGFDLFFREDGCSWPERDPDQPITIIEKERLVLLKRDPNAPTTSITTKTTGPISSSIVTTTSSNSDPTTQSRWRKRQGRKKNQRRRRTGGKYGKK